MSNPEQLVNQDQANKQDPLRQYIQAHLHLRPDPQAPLTTTDLLDLIQSGLRSLAPEVRASFTANAKQWLAPDALQQLSAGKRRELNPSILKRLTLDALQWLTPAMVGRLIQGNIRRLTPESFRQFVAERSAADLYTWLLEGFAADDFPPFILDDEPSAVLQLHSAFDTLPLDLQERCRGAVTEAVAALAPESQDEETIIDILDLAVSINAADCIPILIDKLNTYLGQPAAHGGEEENIVDFILAALHGFAPHQEIKKEFERLYSSVSLDLQPYAAQLLLGLCTCNPDEFPRYLSRFVELERQHPNSYAIPQIVDQLVEIVRLKRIAENFPWFKAPIQDQLFDWLCVEPWRPADLTLEDESDDPNFQLFPREPSSLASPIPIRLPRRLSLRYLGKLNQRIKKEGAVSGVSKVEKTIEVGQQVKII